MIVLNILIVIVMMTIIILLLLLLLVTFTHSYICFWKLCITVTKWHYKFQTNN